MGNEHNQTFYNETISHIYFSYTNVRKGHPRACTDARTCLIFLKKKKEVTTVQSEQCYWRMLYRGEVTFGPFYMRCHTLSLNKPAVYKPAVKLMPLKWKAHRDELLFTVYRRTGCSKTTVRFCAFEHTSARTDRWKIKNIASHIVQNHTEFYSIASSTE